jgi:hypothetical protein
MKKCPECYAIMKELEQQKQIPDLPQPSSDVYPSNDVAKVRYECSQCGHFEDALPVLSRTPVKR